AFHLEKPGTQPAGTTLHRFRPRGRDAPGKAPDVMSGCGRIASFHGGPQFGGFRSEADINSTSSQNAYEYTPSERRDGTNERFSQGQRCIVRFRRADGRLSAGCPQRRLIVLWLTA